MILLKDKLIPRKAQWHLNIKTNIICFLVHFLCMFKINALQQGKTKCHRKKNQHKYDFRWKMEFQINSENSVVKMIIDANHLNQNAWKWIILCYKHNVVCKIVRINKSVVQGEINFAIILGNYCCLKCVCIYYKW